MHFNDISQGYLGKEYALGRGYTSSMRLNLQNYLLRQLLGYSIHPNITSSGKLPSDAKIADVGTGTAQWLIDVNQKLPSAELDGFDISKEQFPVWLPSQISLHELDITKPLPSSLEGKYDLVHVQLFLCVVQQSDPTAIVKELFKMLSESR